MTVGDKLHMTLGMLTTAAGQMHTFAMDTKDPMAQQMYTDMAYKLDQICTDLRSRINYVEEQEPQYSMENMQQQKLDNMQQQ